MICLNMANHQQDLCVGQCVSKTRVGDAAEGRRRIVLPVSPHYRTPTLSH